MRSAKLVFLLAICCSLTLTEAMAQPNNRDTVSIPQLLANLEEDNVRIASSAARSLGVIFSPGSKRVDERSKVIEQLISKLDSSLGAQLRREAAVALGRIQAKEAVEKLTTTMSDEDIEVAVAAGEAIAKTLPVDEARKLLTEQGTQEGESVQVAAYQGMTSICKPEDQDFLLKGLTGENWRTQMNAVKGLERIVRAGSQLTPEQYDQVAAVFENEITNAANAAVHFFTHVRNEEALKAVLKAAETTGDGSKTDTTWRMRTYALRTLYHIGWPTTRDVLPVVIRQLGDRTANVTNEARRILYNLTNEKLMSRSDLFPYYLKELEQAEALALRAGIMKEMGSHVDEEHASRVAKVAADTLTAAKAEPKLWQARAYSLTLLAASGYTGTIDEVAQAVFDNVSNVRNAAGNALQKLGSLCTPEQRDKVAPILQPLLETPTDWRKTTVAARSVGYYAQQDSIPALAKLLSHSVLNVRDAAAHSLAHCASTKDAEFRQLIETHVHEAINKTPQAWQYGAIVLGALENVNALPLLTTILEKGTWRAQQQAALAVEHIAKKNTVNDQPLSDALIKASQSDILQVQDSANRALRALTKVKKPAATEADF